VLKQRFFLVAARSGINGIRLQFRSSGGSLLMLDTQSQFMLADFQ
jgi:hypothetical protein